MLVIKRLQQGTGARIGLVTGTGHGSSNCHKMIFAAQSSCAAVPLPHRHACRRNCCDMCAQLLLVVLAPTSILARSDHVKAQVTFTLHGCKVQLHETLAKRRCSDVCANPSIQKQKPDQLGCDTPEQACMAKICYMGQNMQGVRVWASRTSSVHIRRQSQVCDEQPADLNGYLNSWKCC